MKAEQIIRQLQLSMPLFSDLFSDFVAPTSIVVVSQVATVTATAHGLSSLQKVFVKNGQIPNALTSLTASGLIATATTTNQHDLTTGFTKSVSIFGATEPEYNGTFNFIKDIGHNQFQYQLIDSPATSPATGAPTLNEARLNEGVNGLKTITVIDANTFTYPAENSPDVTVTGSPLFAPVTNPDNTLIGTRISGALSIQRAMESYTRQGKDKAWLFVILEDRDISRDRNVTTDSIAEFGAGTDIRQRIIAPFTIYVVMPTSDSLSGMRERDIMEDVSEALYRSLVGVEFDSDLSQRTWSAVASVGHGFFDYVGAYYIHQFSFQNQNDITAADTARANNLTRAFTQAGLSISPANANATTEKLTVTTLID